MSGWHKGDGQRPKRKVDDDAPDVIAMARMATSGLVGDGSYPIFESELRRCYAYHTPDREAPISRPWPRVNITGSFRSISLRFPA